jgi:hypothetical protein
VELEQPLPEQIVGVELIAPSSVQIARITR